MGKVVAKFTYSGADQSVTAGGNIQFNGQAISCGRVVGYDGNGGIQLKLRGNYKISATFDLVATSAAEVAVRLFKNGAAENGAVAYQTPAAIGDNVSMALVDAVTVQYSETGYVTVTFRPTIATTVDNAIVVIERD